MKADIKTKVELQFSNEENYENNQLLMYGEETTVNELDLLISAVGKYLTETEDYTHVRHISVHMGIGEVEIDRRNMEYLYDQLKGLKEMERRGFSG